MFLFNFYDSPICCRRYFSDDGADYSPSPPLSFGSVSKRILQPNASYSDAGPEPATTSDTVARPHHSFSPYDATTRCQILRPSPTCYFSPALNPWSGTASSKRPSSSEP